MKIPVETSARHVHLSKKDFIKLFGNCSKLHCIKKLSQPGEFAAKQEVELINGKEKLKARVLGPLRKYSQVEISLTDSIELGIKVPIKLSGNLKGVPKIKVRGKKGVAKIPVIIAKRHLHCSKQQAKKLKLKNNQKVSVKVKGDREIIFDNINVRISEDYKLALHIDTDEANAAGIGKKGWGELVR
jgi:putative phosphotransacetylase